MPSEPGIRHDITLGLYCLPAIIVISVPSAMVGHMRHAGDGWCAYGSSSA